MSEKSSQKSRGGPACGPVMGQYEIVKRLLLPW